MRTSLKKGPNGTGWDVCYRDEHSNFECWKKVAVLIQRLPALENLHHLHDE